MATIRTAIELNDNFSSVLNNIVNAMNMAVSVMEQMQGTMSDPVDTSAFDGIRDYADRATMAVRELDEAMQSMEPPVIPEMPALAQTPPVAVETPAFVQEPLDPVTIPIQIQEPIDPVTVPIQVQEPIDPVDITVQIRELPEIVEIPVQWQTDSLEIFTNSGIERFEQEVQSANELLHQLGETQNIIAANSQQTSLFPPQMTADLTNMHGRIMAISQRIQQIESNPLNMGTDIANNELEQLRAQLNQAVQQQEMLNQAVDSMDIQAANQAYLQLSQTVGNTERYIRDNVDEQGRFNNTIEEGTEQANGLMNTIKGTVAAYATIQTAQKAFDLSDQLTSTTARLDLMNDGLQTTQELQNMIFFSAERSRGLYQQTADTVSKLGLMAGDAFSSSEEIIAFTEQLNKQFTIAGTEAAGIDAAMLQLTQAMSSGILRGEEFNSILEQAPNIIQAIADYMEVPKGQLKDMAADGLISAEIVKAAMFAAADETNAKFEQMPKTFSQIWSSFQNNALMAFQPVLMRMNEIANSEKFQNFVNRAVNGLSSVANVALGIFDFMIGIADVVADNWGWLSPIIGGVTAALIAYYTALGVYNGVQLVSNGIKAAAAIAEKVHAASLAMESGATFGATAAQYGFNAALLACPITWIIILIIALIAVFFAVIGVINKVTGSSISAIGIITGALAVAGAFVWDLFLGLLDLVLGIINYWVNPILAFVNFFGNVFNDPIGSIIHLFGDLADNVLGVIEKIASALDFVFGSNMADTVHGWRDSLSDMVDTAAKEYGNGQYEEIISALDLSVEGLGLKRIAYSDAWTAGYNFGEELENSFSANDALSSARDQTDTFLGGIGNSTENIDDTTGDIADSVTISEEDLKYLRDIAEQETVNRFTTAEITVEQHNTNNISSKMDIDGVIDELTEATTEAVYIIAEGVHV